MHHLPLDGEYLRLEDREDVRMDADQPYSESLDSITSRSHYLPVKVEDDSIYISVRSGGDLAEIVFGGASTAGQAGKTATNINVDEVCVWNLK